MISFIHYCDRDCYRDRYRDRDRDRYRDCYRDRNRYRDRALDRKRGRYHDRDCGCYRYRDRYDRYRDCYRDRALDRKRGCYHDRDCGCYRYDRYRDRYDRYRDCYRYRDRDRDLHCDHYHYYSTEQLDGESPFRLFSSLTKEIADMAGCAPADIRPDLVDRPLKVNSPDRPVVLKPADVKEEQWYSTEEGMQLFGKIHAALRVNGIAVIETSRDTQTHDIGFTLQLDQHSFRVEFPRNFPRGMASLTEGRKRVNIDLKEVDASSKRARTSAEEEPPKEQHKDGAKFEGDPPQEKECSLQDHDKLSQHLIEKIKRQLSLKVTAAGRHEFGTPV